jgi:hypothetical protein
MGSGGAGAGVVVGGGGGGWGWGGGSSGGGGSGGGRGGSGVLLQPVDVPSVRWATMQQEMDEWVAEQAGLESTE